MGYGLTSPQTAETLQLVNEAFLKGYSETAEDERQTQQEAANKEAEQTKLDQQMQIQREQEAREDAANAEATRQKLADAKSLSVKESNTTFLSGVGNILQPYTAKATEVASDTSGMYTPESIKLAQQNLGAINQTTAQLAQDAQNPNVYLPTRYAGPAAAIPALSQNYEFSDAYKNELKAESDEIIQKPGLDKEKADAQVASDNERVRHDKAMEGAAFQRVAIARQRADAASTAPSPYADQHTAQVNAWQNLQVAGQMSKDSNVAKQIPALQSGVAQATQQVVLNAANGAYDEQGLPNGQNVSDFAKGYINDNRFGGLSSFNDVQKAYTDLGSKMGTLPQGSAYYAAKKLYNVMTGRMPANYFQPRAQAPLVPYQGTSGTNDTEDDDADN